MKISSREIFTCRISRILVKHSIRPYYAKCYAVDKQSILVIVPLKQRRFRVLCTLTGLKLFDTETRGRASHILIQLLDRMNTNARFKNAITKTSIQDAIDYRKSGVATQRIKLIQNFLHRFISRGDIITQKDNQATAFKYPPEYIDVGIFINYKK